MNQKERELIEQLKSLGGNNRGSNLLLKVTTIDENAETCEANDQSDITYYNIRLKSIIDSVNSIVIFPKLDSYIIASPIGLSNELAVVKYSIIDKIVIKTESVEFTLDNEKIEFAIGGTTMLANSDGIVFNGGNLKGLVKLDALVQKLNAVENDINNLKTAFTTWVPVPTDGGAALKAASATWSAAQLTPTQAANIENTKIKQ